MIVFVRGRIADRGRGFVDVDVSGVGYRVWVPEGVATRLEPGQDVQLYTYHHVREDGQQLFGFEHAADRDWFEWILGVSGIGPKGAMQILSCCSRTELAAAIAAEDVDALCRLPGVGRKTAQRLVLELKEKAAQWRDVPPGTAAADAASANVRLPRRRTDRQPPAADLRADVVEALRVLGYNERQALEAAEVAVGDTSVAGVEEALRLALRHLDRQRPPIR
ncbi:MAG: Holliday junction branch migration protein RuvA [Alicyclobacillaceae bacterium]|nr:Holliday junction branch migration protein RuvA [Alicyclobacillaceae bacterium]